MKSSLIKILVAILFFILLQSCVDHPNVIQTDSEYPVVKIISPLNNETLVDSTAIEVDATDNKGIVQVEIYINNQTDSTRTFYVPPYKYIWLPPSDLDSAKYSIYAKAYDADGNIGTSEVIIVFVRKFGAPSNLNLVSVSETAIRLNWDDNSSVETGFEVERRKNESQFELIAKLDSNITTYLDDSLSIEDQYIYRVRAINDELFTNYSENIIIKYYWVFSQEYLIDGQGLNGNWGNLYSPVRISNDNTIYSYAYENHQSFTTQKINDPNNIWAYYLDNDTGVIFDVKFNYTDNKFLLATNLGKIYSWTAYSNSSPGKIFQTDSDTIFSVSFCKTKNIFASSEATGRLTVWNYNTGVRQTIVNSLVEGRTIVLLSKDGNTLISGDTNGMIKYYDANNGILWKNIDAHNNSITQLIYNEEQNILISTSLDGYVKFWEMNSGDYITGFFAHAGGATDVTINTEGTKFFTCGLDRKFNYYTYPALNKVFSFYDVRIKDYLTASLSPNSERVLVGGNRHIGLYKDTSSWMVIEK